MRSPSPARRAALGINLTPLIDVSFLLIVFFIVSSHLAQQEVRQALDLPAATSGERIEEEHPRLLVLNVDANGRVTISGEEVHCDELPPRLAAQRKRWGADLEVRIRSDRGVPYRLIEPILVSCAKVGLSRVTFAVTSPRD